MSDDWESLLSGANENLGPQFHHEGDGAFSPGQAFDTYSEFHTAPYALEMPYSRDYKDRNRLAPGHYADHEQMQKVTPRLAAKATKVEQGNPLKVYRGDKRTTVNTWNGWNNRQTMN